MDLTSTVRTDTLPAVASVLMPGVGALTPYAAVLLTSRPEVAGYASGHEATVLLVGVLLAVGAGFLIESIGSYVEYYVIDRRHSNRDAMIAAWWRYLRVAWETEPTGQHYLRRILAVFKFELNTCVAAIAAIPGIVWLAWGAAISAGVAIAVVLILLGVAAYLFHAATQTSRLLAQLREQLLLGVREPPFVETGPQARV